MAAPVVADDAARRCSAAARPPGDASRARYHSCPAKIRFVSMQKAWRFLERARSGDRLPGCRLVPLSMIAIRAVRGAAAAGRRSGSRARARRGGGGGDRPQWLRVSAAGDEAGHARRRSPAIAVRGRHVRATTAAIRSCRTCSGSTTTTRSRSRASSIATASPIGELGSEKRTVVPYRAIPKMLVQAVVAAEDADYFKHGGVDYMGHGARVHRERAARAARRRAARRSRSRW